MAEYGFLVVTLGSRSAPGQGKRVLDQVYLKLGTADDSVYIERDMWIPQEDKEGYESGSAMNSAAPAPFA